jgi:hypothetical protein
MMMRNTHHINSLNVVYSERVHQWISVLGNDELDCCGLRRLRQFLCKIVLSIMFGL